MFRNPRMRSNLAAFVFFKNERVAEAVYLSQLRSQTEKARKKATRARNGDSRIGLSFKATNSSFPSL